MKRRIGERVFALFFAVLFLASSSALAILVIINNVQGDNSQDTTAQQTTNKENANMLQGTKLQNFTPVASVPQLQVIDTKVGDGNEVKAGDTVTVDYTGAVAATGVIFQSSLDSGQPVSFGLSQVIPGWSQGIPGMKVGGTRRLLIPAGLAYGANPPAGSGIPVNAGLVFDVTLHSIGK